MFLSNWGYEKAWHFWFEPAMVIPLSIDSPPLEEQMKTVMLQEKEPEFRGSLEHLGWSTEDLQWGKAGGWTIGLPPSSCPLRPTPPLRSQLPLLPGGSLGPPASLCIPEGTQAPFFLFLV